MNDTTRSQRNMLHSPKARITCLCLPQFGHLVAECFHLSRSRMKHRNIHVFFSRFLFAQLVQLLLSLAEIQHGCLAAQCFVCPHWRTLQEVYLKVVIKYVRSLSSLLLCCPVTVELFCHLWHTFLLLSRGLIRYLSKLESLRETEGAAEIKHSCKVLKPTSTPGV